jgi:hypothetical protein
MTRRELLVLMGSAAALPVRADSASEVWDVVAAMAAALAEDNAPGFLKPVDLRTPGYDLLAQDVTGMLMQAEAQSGILPVRNEGDDWGRTVEVNWELRLRRKGNDLRTETRRVPVTLRFVREGKRWKVVGMDPISLFAPPNFR